MTEAVARTSWHLWVVGVVAVLFNAIGVIDYLMSMTQGASYMASAGMTPAQIEHYQQLPAWMTAVWAIGVWSAIVGSVLILLRRKLAFPVFVLSLAAFLLSVLYNFGLSGAAEIMGRQAAAMSAVIAAVLIFLGAYAARMSRRDVLR